MRLTRLGKFGQTYYLDTICGDANKTKITFISGHGNKEITVNQPIEVLSQCWYNWQMLGQPIQDAFSTLSNSEREFILTGTTQEEWEKMFPKVICPHCQSKNTECDVDESSFGGEELVHITVNCLDCKQSSPFPEGLDWREYV